MGKTFRFSILPLFLSLLFGGLWIVIGGFLYDNLLDKIWTPLLVAIYMTGLALFLFIAIIISNAIGNNAKPSSSAYVKSLITIAAIFVLTMLFEFLYELDGLNIKEPIIKSDKASSYVFLIDNSGSMSMNDPNKKANDAIYSIMKECDDDFKYAVYGFGSATECTQVKPMRKASEAKSTDDYANYYSGWNDIMSGIELVLDDIESGELDAGKKPKIIVLADGDDNGKSKFTSVMERCNSNNVVVSTVGFGFAMDEEHLKDIAEATGGEYVRAEDADQLTDAIGTAARGGASVILAARNLLNYRHSVDSMGRNILLGALRILFIGIIAVAFMFIKIFMYSTVDSKNIALITFIVLAVLGTLAMEFGMVSPHIVPEIMRAFMCICFTLLFGTAVGEEEPSASGMFSATGDKRIFY